MNIENKLLKIDDFNNMANKNHKKSELHPRNRHNKRYDFKELIGSCEELEHYVILNKYNDFSIDFSNPDAVKILNKALLKHYYGIKNWDIPKSYLTPPIPGRADYIHYIADLLGSRSSGKITYGKNITCLDIGVGANCIYPIIGNYEYGWSFIGSDIDEVSLKSAKRIIDSNAFLKRDVQLRLQNNPHKIFDGIIKNDEYIDIVICNPPFHASMAEARLGTLRKLSNLNKKKITQATLNFGGNNSELWCKGGEKTFVKDMILQSMHYATSCLWFSSLVSKQSHLNSYYKLLQRAGAYDVRTIAMSQGNKVSRILAWTFHTKNTHKHNWK